MSSTGTNPGYRSISCWLVACDMLCYSGAIHPFLGMAHACGLNAMFSKVQLLVERTN
jgi:hypothetical protein